MKRHPAYCQIYLECTFGYEYFRKCPPGLVFNNEIQCCDYIHNVPECQELTTSSTTVSFLS